MRTLVVLVAFTTFALLGAWFARQPRRPRLRRLVFIVRGVPTFPLHRGDLEPKQRWALAALASTALPLIVVITTVGAEVGVLEPAIAAAIVAAGVLSVLVYRAMAARLQKTSGSVTNDAQPTQPGHEEDGA